MINDLKFIANDFATNCYGFKVDTAGIDLSRHTNTNTTPAFYNHDRSKMPLGVWKNFEKVGGKLVATGLELDMHDECAVKMARKIDLGHLNSVSMGLIVKEFENIGGCLVAVKSELLELSIVDTPANPNAVRLYEMNTEGNLVQLSVTDFETQKLKSLTINIESLLPTPIEIQRYTESEAQTATKLVKESILKATQKNEIMENLITKELFDTLSLRMDTLETEQTTLKAENAQLKADLATEKENKVTAKDILLAVQIKEMAHPKEEETLLGYFEKHKGKTFMEIYKLDNGDVMLSNLRVAHPEIHSQLKR